MTARQACSGQRAAEHLEAWPGVAGAQVLVVARPREAAVRPVLEVSGLKSWSTFAKGASLLLVHRDGDVVSAAPQQNQGSGGPDEVGDLVGRAFDAAGS